MARVKNIQKEWEKFLEKDDEENETERND